MADETKYVSETNEASKRPNPDPSDAKGTMQGDRGDAKAEPSGYTGQNPSTSGSGSTEIRNSSTPESATGHIDPSAPGATGTTPGSNT